jgi:Tfp pilus assembly protein PilF
LAVAGRTAESAKSYQKAVQIDPSLVGAYLGLGHTLKTMGDLEGGISAYKKARKLKPNIGEISFSLSNLKTFRFSDLEIEDMKRRLNNPKLDKPSKVAF